MTTNTQELPSKVQEFLLKLNRNHFTYSLSVERFNEHHTVIAIKSVDSDSHGDFVYSSFHLTKGHINEVGRNIKTSIKHRTYHFGGTSDKKETRNEHEAMVMWALHSRRVVKAGI